MKTAKEMFEKLGYKIFENSKTILYTKTFYVETYSVESVIIFTKINPFCDFGVEFDCFYNDGTKYHYAYKPQEIEAIRQQMKELGWIE